MNSLYQWLVLAGVLLPAFCQAAEPWSDDRLPVQEGVEFWFDCSVQNAARNALHLPAQGTDNGTDFLFDGSGHARHLTQLLPDARPRFRRESQLAFLSFDGNKQALLASGLRAQLTNATVFVVAVPRSNRGAFRGVFGLSRTGINDYVGGINLDLGPQASAELSSINVEGSGMGGAVQLLHSPPRAFGPWHVFALQIASGPQSVRFFLDGHREGTRDRGNAVMSANEFVLGGRYYSNDGEPPYAQGFFDGDIAEFLCYGRVLSDTERAAVDEYLADKYAALLKPNPVLAQENASLDAAPLEIAGAPPPRNRLELEGVLKSTGAAVSTGTAPAPFHIVLCAGPKDHGPGEHDYPLWQKRWSRLLAMAEEVKVSTAWEWPNAEQLKTAQVLVFYSDNPGWSQARAAELDRCLARGCGLVFIHYAVDGHDQVEALAQRLGLAWRGGFSKFRHGALDLKLEPGPLTAGLPGLHFIDESYWNLVGDIHDCQLVASALEDGQAQPLLWTRTQGQGRVFVNILGHYTWTFDDPFFRLLTLRGICWAGGQPLDRLSRLAAIGARIED